MMKEPSTSKGFTLLEMVFVVLMISIIATMTTSLFLRGSDAEQFEATRQKMESIRKAILGSNQLDPRGMRTDFGYHGDMGQLPTSLSLLTAAQTPAWAYVATYGFGAGWKGPYYSPRYFDPYTINTDAWGRAFVFNTTSLTSYGSDGVAGGTVYGTDLVMIFSTADRLSRVRGIVKDGPSGLGSRTVSAVYPSAGLMTTASTVTDANGFFFFDGIPFGPRSVLVTDSPGIGPRAVTVGAPEVFLPPDTLNYYGGAQRVTVNTSTAGCVAADKLQHRVGVTSSYLSAPTLAYLTVWWESTAARLNTIVLNSTAQSVGSVASGTRISITKTMTLPVSSQRDLELRWSRKNDSDNVAAEMEWTGISDKDEISWIANTCANPDIAVNNPVSGTYGSSRTITTTAYTVPASTVDAMLVVVAGSSDDNNNVSPSSATYTGKAMTLVTAGIGGSSGNRSGTGMFWLAVTSLQSGDIVVTFPGAAEDHLVFAASLNSTDPAGPEAKALNTTGAGLTAASVITLSDFAMVMSGGQLTANKQAYSTGTYGAGLHIIDIEARTGNGTGAMGHFPVDSPLSVQGIGFTAVGATNSAVAVGVFKYKP